MKSKWYMTVSEHLDKGSRGYMEDCICNHLEKVNGNVLFAIFGVFDGHGGSDAANYVKKSLVEELKRNNNFWSNNDNSVLLAIKEVYHRIQNLMWVEREKWPQRITGYKSTAGTTATIAIIRNNSIYVGHVGDSGIVLANLNNIQGIKSEQITQEHKPNDVNEKKRIENSGGSIKRKAGIARIVWNRRKISSKNEIEQVPFLAVSRSLGDLWSYDLSSNLYHVSPEPDVLTIKLDEKVHRALILASDGVWNVVTGDTAVRVLMVGNHLQCGNPAELLVTYSLYQWKKRNMRPDNISAIVVHLIPESSPEAWIPEENGVFDLESEIIDNNIMSERNIPRTKEVLDSVTNFIEYVPIGLTIRDCKQEEIEMFKSFVLYSEKLSFHCLPWLNDSSYWEALKSSFVNLGITRFPNLISYFDSPSSAGLEEMFASYSWSVVCLQCIDETPSLILESAMIRNQPLLTDFWTSFYREIVRPNLLVVEDELIDQSIYHMNMVYILTEKRLQLRRFLDSVRHPFISLPYTLKKSQSCNQGISQPVYAMTRKRSSSLNLNSIESLNLSTQPNISYSSMSTPIMSPTPVIHKQRDISFLRKRRTKLLKIPRISFKSFKRSHFLSKRRFVRHVTSRKSRTLR